MKQTLLAAIALCTFLFSAMHASAQGSEPEILYYKFDQTGSTITNEATNAPVGTNTATIIGGQSQGGAGLCQTGLIGTGGVSSVDYVDTGWDTNLGTGAWTIAFWTNNLPSTGSALHQFGDPGPAAFRCFANGLAGPENFMLRGSFTPVLCFGCAPVGAPTMVAFVYDPTLGNIKAYHNGVLNNTMNQSALNISGTDFKVGGFANSLGLGSGQIMDEFRVYDRALDSYEVFLTYNDCLPLNLSNNAGVASIDEPTNFCEGTEDVVVTIENFGANQIDSCIVQWEIDAIPQPPFYYYGLLDTVGGVGPSSAQVTIGSAFFSVGSTEIKAWTELPNGMVDLGTFNDTASLIVQPALTGNLTIGGNSPTFVDFTAATAYLNAYGVCGPTVFDVRTGTYTEQVVLDSIPGTSAINTVTFRSEAGHRDSVVLQDDGTLYFQNFTMKFYKADHISIEQLTIRTTITSQYVSLVIFDGGSSYNTIWDCRLIGADINFPANAQDNSVIFSENFSQNHPDEYNSFIHNTLENSHYSINWSGTYLNNENGNVFKDNLMLNAIIGTQIAYQDDLIFEDNTYISEGTSSYIHFGVDFAACRGLYLNGNKVTIGPNRYGYGLKLHGCSGNASQPAIVSNNMISFQAQSLQYSGFGLTINACDHVKLFNNSVNVQTSSDGSRAFYSNEGGENELKNNIFVADGPGYAGYFKTEYSISESDYNNFYSTGTNFIYHVDTNFVVFSDYVDHTLLDSNSILVDPLFYSFEDLHVCNNYLNEAGIPLSFVTDDFDGQARNVTNPDIGADEFGPSADGTLCIGDVLTLWTGSPSDTMLWSTGDTTQSITVSAPGTYFVDYTGVCGTQADTIHIDSSALIYYNFVDVDTNFFCLPGSANLNSLQSASSYEWSTTDTTQNIVVTSGGTYTLMLEDACGSGIDSVTIVGASSPATSFTTAISYLTSFFTNMTVADGTVTYNWDFGDGNSSTQENPVHIYAAAGTYLVNLTVSNECGTTSYSDSIMVSTLGLEEMLNANSFALYPNPNTGSFTLDFLGAEHSSADVIISNELGQKIYSTILNGSAGNTSEKIDLGNIEAGLYFITIVIDGVPSVSKFIVNHD